MSSEGDLNLHGWRNGTAGQTGSLTRSTLGGRIPWTMIERRWYMNEPLLERVAKWRMSLSSRPQQC